MFAKHLIICENIRVEIEKRRVRSEALIQDQHYSIEDYGLSVEVILNEGEEEIIPSFNKLQEFVSEAARKRIHLGVPRAHGQSDQQWGNQWNMLGAYLYTNASLSDISRAYQCSRQNVNVIIKNAARRLYESSPLELQEQFDPNGFLFRKPASERKQPRISQAESGSGIEYSYTTCTKKFTEELYNSDLSVQERQQLLNQMGRGFVNKGHKAPVFKLSTLIRESGLHSSGHNNSIPRIIEAVKRWGIPIRMIEERYRDEGIMRYGIGFNTDRAAIKEVLETDPSLADLRKG